MRTSTWRLQKVSETEFGILLLIPTSFANFVFEDFEQLYVNLQTQITKLYKFCIGKNCVEKILSHMIEHNKILEWNEAVSGEFSRLTTRLCCTKWTNIVFSIFSSLFIKIRSKLGQWEVKKNDKRLSEWWKISKKFVTIIFTNDFKVTKPLLINLFNFT